MKIYEVVEVQLQFFWTLALYGYEWSASSPGHLPLDKIFLEPIVKETG
jgi:hypothetical protein